MRPNQLWLDLAGPELRVWVDERLMLAQARGSTQQRMGFFREIPLFHLAPASAHPMGWSSFPWSDLQGKFRLENDFWMALDAARFAFLQERPEKFSVPLSYELPLASDVVFYAGTFTPWHQGHQACLQLAPTHLPLIICPDKNPHKPLTTHQDVVSFFLQLKQTIQQQATLKHLPLYPGFLLQQERNPTVSWVLRLKRARPDLRVHLLLGYDSFQQLPHWTDARDLIKLLSGIMVASRLENDGAHQQDCMAVQQHNPQLQIQFLGHHPFEHVSSSQLRQK